MFLKMRIEGTIICCKFRQNVNKKATVAQKQYTVYASTKILLKVNVIALHVHIQQTCFCKHVVYVHSWVRAHIHTLHGVVVCACFVHDSPQKQHKFKLHP